MSWFARLCRNTGLMIHYVIKPMKKKSNKYILSEKTEEEQINETTTLRRTTIEEIEIKRHNDS